MSTCMLCQVRRAEHPYYIKSVGLRIWSVEELLYFMQHNLVLLDETILNEALVLWLKDELHMRRLALGLSVLLQKTFSVRSFILPIFEETGYPDRDVPAEIEAGLKELDALPIPARMKQKGDALTGHGNYVQAISAYESVLALQQDATLDAQFRGLIYNNMGCAYAHLFQMDEACICLRRGMELLRTDEARTRYLRAVYLRGGREALKNEATRISAEPGTADAIERAAGALPPPVMPADVEQTLNKWARDYHRQTGM